MCWNATASLSAFISGMFTSLIVAMIAYKQQKWQLFALSIGWTWVICMQLWEYFLWKNTMPSTTNTFYSNMAYVFNVTQVLLLGLIFLTFFQNDTSRTSRGIAFAILFTYMCYILYFSPSCGVMTVSPSCMNPHLEYPWWQNIPFGGLFYLFTLISIFVLLIRPLDWSIKTISVIMVLFLISWIFYSKSVASIWCFFAVFTPVISLLLS